MLRTDGPSLLHGVKTGSCLMAVRVGTCMCVYTQLHSYIPGTFDATGRVTAASPLSDRILGGATTTSEYCLPRPVKAGPVVAVITGFVHLDCFCTWTRTRSAPRSRYTHHCLMWVHLSSLSASPWTRPRQLPRNHPPPPRPLPSIDCQAYIYN